MRLFALKDANDPDSAILAILSCYEAEDEFYIDMPEGTDPWTVPFVLSDFAERSCWTVDPRWSRWWVESRVVPPSRQNLGEILRENGLERYDALSLFELTDGRNCQDSCYVEPIGCSALPDWFCERERASLMGAVALPGFRLLVVFRSGEVRLIGRDDIVEMEPAAARIVDDAAAFGLMRLCAGGRGVRWGNALRLSDAQLALAGTALPLTWEDLATIAPALLVDSSEAAAMLGCSRQNLHALIKRGALRPVKAAGKTTLFLRADIAERMRS